MRKLTYLAVLEPTNTGYSIYFPDLPGCISVGNSLPEAQLHAKEALELHIYGMERDGEALPSPSLQLNPEDIQGCIVIAISIFPDMVKNEMDNRRVKTNVTIPAWLKNIAEANKVNYSRILEVALIEYLGAQKK